jgi:hypothetical protein
MDNVEKHRDNHEGFFGTVSFAIPEELKSARVERVELRVPDGRDLGVLYAAPIMGESVFHIGDGQGRLVGFHSLERTLEKKRIQLMDQIKKADKKGEDASELRRRLDEIMAQLGRIRRFLSETDLSFLCYASAILPDGSLVGLNDEAQRRLYVEGNALNSQASKEGSEV